MALLLDRWLVDQAAGDVAAGQSVVTAAAASQKAYCNPPVPPHDVSTPENSPLKLADRDSRAESSNVPPMPVAAALREACTPSTWNDVSGAARKEALIDRVVLNSCTNPRSMNGVNRLFPLNRIVVLSRAPSVSGADSSEAYP